MRVLLLGTAYQYHVLPQLSGFGDYFTLLAFKISTSVSHSSRAVARFPDSALKLTRLSDMAWWKGPQAWAADPRTVVSGLCYQTVALCYSKTWGESDAPRISGLILYL